MKRWERLAGRKPAESRSGLLTMDDYASFFSFGGLQYPIVQTSLSQVKDEQLPWTQTEAFRMSSPVFALVQARMQVFSQIRFQWTRFTGGAPTDLFGSPELSILERPWPNGTTSDLLARMEVDVSTAGNAYIVRHGSTLHRLYPQWVMIVLGSNENADRPSEASDTTVAGYTYRPPNAPMQFFLPNEVAHYAPIPDPDFNYLGMSWLSPVIRDVQADSAQTEHKMAFLKNAATPNMVIKFDPAVGLQQVKEFRELAEEEHAGALNAWKTLYLGGGADATVVGKDFKELDFAATQGKGESRLAAAAGVPPSWVGFSEGLQGSALNAGNFTAARRRYSDGTMQHLWANAASSLEAIVRRPDSGASLWFSTAAAPFMREDAADLAGIQQKQAATITSLVRDGFTAESAVAAVLNNDWSRLVHTGLTSVQLQPPSNGQEPDPDLVGNTNGAGA